MKSLLLSVKLSYVCYGPVISAYSVRRTFDGITSHIDVTKVRQMFESWKAIVVATVASLIGTEINQVDWRRM